VEYEMQIVKKNSIPNEQNKTSFRLYSCVTFCLKSYRK
jgi:hypothetical protein